ncbi:hypothetical protein C8039_10240 [Halogeometricum sp. wsp3]|nr:hypothetical protein C8039_10240 [Halogeometricum sp. wsp3]
MPTGRQCSGSLCSSRRSSLRRETRPRRSGGRDGLIEAKPDDLELVLTVGHERPKCLTDHADLITEVSKEKHPIDAGQGARKGTEF